MAIRRLPDKIVYAGKIESWLKDMAKEGFILRRMGRYFAIFKKVDPQDIINELNERDDEELENPLDVNYRIMAYDSDYFVDEVIDAAQKAGWQLLQRDIWLVILGFTFNHNKYYLFKTPNEEPDQSLTPLHTNGWLSKNMTRQKHMTRNLIRISKILAFFGVICFLFFYTMYISGVLLTLSLLLLLLAWTEKKEKQKIADVENSDYHEYKDWREDLGVTKLKRVGRFFLKLTAFIYAVLLMTSPLLMLKKTNLDNTYGFIRLEDVQQAYEYDIQPTYGASIPTPFVPISFKAIEMGLAKDKAGNVKRVEYEISYSKSIIPFVSRLPYFLCKERKVSSNSHHIIMNEVSTSSERFDKIDYIETKWMLEDLVFLCMANDFEIIYIKYQGDKTGEELIENIEKTIAER